MVGFPLARSLSSIASAAWAVRIVRRLLRYYESVRLPIPVHHRRMSLDFPMRSALADDDGISQFPSGMFPCMLGVLDLVGFSCSIGNRCYRFRLPPMRTTSATQFSMKISRLITRPARTSINVPPAPLQAPAYDPRPAWFAIPSLWDSFIPDIPTALTGYSRNLQHPFALSNINNLHPL